MSSESSNPYDAFNFRVTIQGGPTADFSECVLPSVSIDVMEYRNGSDLVTTTHKIPGLVRYGNLILKRGLAGSTALWEWFDQFVTGAGSPSAMSVMLLDSQKNAVFRWDFTNCWPVRYESPLLNGRTSTLAIETLEIAVESMQATSLSQ